MVSGIDLSSLSPEVRAEVSRLAAELPADEPETDEVLSQEGLTEKPKAKRTRKSTETPDVGQVLQTLVLQAQEQNRAIVEALTQVRDSYRTLHGELRRTSSPARQEKPDPFAGWDKDDPAQQALAQVLRPIMDRLDNIEAGSQVSNLTARDRAERELWQNFLKEIADAGGVDFGNIWKEIGELPIDQLALQGKTLLTQRLKELGGSKENVETKKERDTLKELVRQTGIYEQLRAAGGGLSEGDIERADRLADAFNRGEVSVEKVKEELEKL